MQDAADLDEIRADMLAVTCQALEPAHVFLWLRERQHATSTAER